MPLRQPTSLPRRLASLEHALGERRRVVDRRAAEAEEENGRRAWAELASDPLRLELLQGLKRAMCAPLPAGVNREELVKERRARFEAYGPSVPEEGGAVMLQYHLELLESGQRGWAPVDALTTEDLRRRRREMLADPVAMGILNEIFRITKGDNWDLRKALTLPGVPELLARLKSHRASMGVTACA